MNMNELGNLTDDIVRAVRKAGDFIRGEMGRVVSDEIETKAKNSLVSYVDQNAEKLLVEDLSKLIPESGFVTEEDTVDNKSAKYTWIIDPLDGTTNFLHAIPHFSTSVALEIDGVLTIGVIYNIMVDEMYYAWKDGGAFMNGRKIHVSNEEELSNSILATGFPYATEYDKKPYFQMMEVIMTQARGMRRFGSAALDMAYVAHGRFEAFYETSLNPWDVAGGIVICREAGAYVGDYFGGESYKSGLSTIVANPVLAKKIQALTKDFFAGSTIATF
ncbi:inositol monophosphatase [Saprospiraceae bacterium]|nr:inositol monophosphatase [Saprospiraceae bacterium]